MVYNVLLATQRSFTLNKSSRIYEVHTFMHDPRIKAHLAETEPAKFILESQVYNALNFLYL